MTPRITQTISRLAHDGWALLPLSADETTMLRPQ